MLDLRKCNYSGKNLSGKTLSGALLADADLSNANLQEAVLTKVGGIGLRGGGETSWQGGGACVLSSTAAQPGAVVHGRHMLWCPGRPSRSGWCTHSCALHMQIAPGAGV